MWARGPLRRSGARLRGRYQAVRQPPPALPPDLDETASCFCRKARRKEREGEAAGDKLYLQEALLERKLPEIDLRRLVDLPRGLDYNEWLASHTLALFDHVNLVYGTVSEFCTAATCADMTGPGGRTYPWYDEKGKKSRVAAPQYIDYVMTFTQKTVSDENIFPTKYANEFPSSFESIVRKIVRLLFHVVAHMYAAHFRELALLRLHAHLHLTFAHLTALHRRFGLIEPKETEVLRDLELALRLTEEPEAASEQPLMEQPRAAPAPLHPHPMLLHSPFATRLPPLSPPIYYRKQKLFESLFLYCIILFLAVSKFAKYRTY